MSFINDISEGGAATIAYLPFWPLVTAGIYDLYALLGSPTPFLYYFLLKQPGIVCDVLVAFLLFEYLEKRGSNMSAFALNAWLFSPFTIFLSAVWGMFESIPVFFLMLALTVRPGAYRGVWAGLATFAKSIPVIYTIPLSRGPRWPATLALAIGIPAVSSVALVWFAGWSFPLFGSTIQNTLPRGGASLSLWEIVYDLNYFGVIPNSILGYSVYTVYNTVGYVWIAAVGAATFVAYRWFGFDTERGLFRSLLFITLTFLLARTAVNEQYSLYLFALMTVDLGLWSSPRKRLFFVYLALMVVEAATNNVLFLRFLTPVYPNALALEFNLIYYYGVPRAIALFSEAMAFCALNLYYLYALSKERHSRTEDDFLYG